VAAGSERQEPKTNKKRKTKLPYPTHRKKINEELVGQWRNEQEKQQRS